MRKVSHFLCWVTGLGHLCTRDYGSQLIRVSHNNFAPECALSVLNSVPKAEVTKAVLDPALPPREPGVRLGLELPGS